MEAESINPSYWIAPIISVYECLEGLVGFTTVLHSLPFQVGYGIRIVSNMSYSSSAYGNLFISMREAINRLA
jgi:hypothetical protein